MTGQPTHFDEPPRICPHCMTNNWQQRERRLVLHDDGTGRGEEFSYIVHRGYETVCATCHPDPRSRKTYVHGEDSDRGRGPFNL